MGSTIVFDFLIFRRRTGPADTGARIVLDLGTDGDEFAVPTRVPTVRRGTSVERELHYCQGRPFQKTNKQTN
jgi:hypothetical protein